MSRPTDSGGQIAAVIGVVIALVSIGDFGPMDELITGMAMFVALIVVILVIIAICTSVSSADSGEEKKG